MSLRPDGYRCDRCGRAVGNGGVQESARITTLNPDDPTEVWNLNLCREPRPGAPRGCEGNVLGPSALVDFDKTKGK